MLKLYGDFLSRPFRVCWMLKESNVPYEHVPVSVEGEDPQARAPWYLALNPNARIPTIDDEGFVLWETPAINFYIARKYRSPLWPDTAAGEARALQWAFYAASDLEPAVVAVRRLKYKCSANKPDSDALARAEDRVVETLGPVNDALEKTGFLQRDRWGLADFMVASVLFSLHEFEYPNFAVFPRLGEWLNASYARPAAREAIALYFAHKRGLQRRAFPQT